MRRVSINFFAALLLILGVTIALWQVEPAGVVRAIGLQNVYLFTFLFGIIGGVSAFTATSFYLTVFMLALGGANPLLLALFSAPGVLIGDMVFWYAGHEGRPLAEHTFSKELHAFSERLRQMPRWFVPIVAYLYTSITPLPGDFLMIALGLIDFPIRRVLLPILLGNFTFALLVSLAAVYGFDSIVRFL